MRCTFIVAINAASKLALPAGVLPCNTLLGVIGVDIWTLMGNHSQ
jgi:hypothetical protein